MCCSSTLQTASQALVPVLRSMVSSMYTVDLTLNGGVPQLTDFSLEQSHTTLTGACVLIDQAVQGLCSGDNERGMMVSILALSPEVACGSHWGAATMM